MLRYAKVRSVTVCPVHHSLWPDGWRQPGATFGQRCLLISLFPLFSFANLAYLYPRTAMNCSDIPRRFECQTVFSLLITITFVSCGLIASPVVFRVVSLHISRFSAVFSCVLSSVRSLSFALPCGRHLSFWLSLQWHRLAYRPLALFLVNLATIESWEKCMNHGNLNENRDNIGHIKHLIPEFRILIRIIWT